VATDFYGLSGFTETLGSNGCSGGIRYTLSVDQSIWYYWTGAAWAMANGSSNQANLASEFTGTALRLFSAQLGLSGKSDLYFKAFLASDGTHSCELDSLQITGKQ
jgi:hypothetical protein